MRNGNIFFLLFFVITAMHLPGGCVSMMGVKKMKAAEEQDILKAAAQYGVSPANSYVLDSSYLSFIRMETKDVPVRYKDHLQPLQAIYYSKADGFIKPVAWYVNCYAGGFPNLNWNGNGGFNQFPPAPQAPADSIVPLKMHFQYLRALPGVQAFNSIEYDYLVLVHWSRFMGRQSELLIKQVQENAALAKEVKLRILYVNNDNFFSRLK